MRALVIKSYKDAKTLKTHQQGEIVEVTNERFEAINSTAHGVFLIAQADAEDKQEKPATKKKTSTRKKK